MDGPRTWTAVLAIAGAAAGAVAGWSVAGAIVVLVASSVAWALARRTAHVAEVERRIGWYWAALVVGFTVVAFGGVAAVVLAVLLVVALLGPTALTRFDRRVSRARARLIAAGVTLSILTLLLILALDPASCCGRYEAIAVLAPRESPPGKGFASTLQLDFAGCNKPVRGRLVVGGSEDYWRAYAKRSSRASRSRPSTFLVSLPHESTQIRDVWLTSETRALAFPGYLDPAEDSHDDLHAERDAEEPSDAKRRLRVSARLRTDSGDPLTAEGWRNSADPGGDGWPVVRGYVERWAEHQAAIVIDFEGDWTRRRDMASCYLNVPALAGEGTVEQAASVLANVAGEYEGDSGDFARAPIYQDYLDQATSPFPSGALYVHRYPDVDGDDRTGVPARARYRASWEVVTGSVTIRWNRGSLDPDASRPAPEQSDNGWPTWQCTAEPYATSRHDRSGAVVGPLNDAYLRGPIEDCRVVAVMESGKPWADRDFLLVLTGALAGLVATLLVDALVLRRS